MVGLTLGYITESMAKLRFECQPSFLNFTEFYSRPLFIEKFIECSQVTHQLKGIEHYNIIVFENTQKIIIVFQG